MTEARTATQARVAVCSVMDIQQAIKDLAALSMGAAAPGCCATWYDQRA